MNGIERLLTNPRVTVRSDGAPEAGGSCVVYWMQRVQRGVDNPALDVAIAAANELRRRVAVFFGLHPRYPNANLRHYTFMVEGLEETKRKIEQRGAAFVLRSYPDQSGQSQAFVLYAEVVDATNKVHPRLQSLALPRHRPRASGQAVQTSTKGYVKPFDECSVDVAFALRQFDHICNGLFRPLIDLPYHTDDSIVFIALDHSRDQNVGPFDKTTLPRFISRRFLAKDILNDGRLTRQAIGAEENCPAQSQGAAFDSRDEIFDQSSITLLTDFSAQPQTG